MSFRIHCSPDTSHLVSYGIKKVVACVHEEKELKPEESQQEACQIVNEESLEVKEEEEVIVIKRNKNKK